MEVLYLFVITRFIQYRQIRMHLFFILLLFTYLLFLLFCSHANLILVFKSTEPKAQNFVQLFLHCVKNVRIRSYSGTYFPTFGLNMERYEVSLRIQSECGKIRNRITANTDTFYAVLPILVIIFKTDFFNQFF